MGTMQGIFCAQLITISAVVKSKSGVEEGNVCTKMCRNSAQNVDLCAVLYSCESCLKYALLNTQFAEGRKILVLSNVRSS